MYLWLKEWLNQKAAILGTILFQFAPYRFVNMYERGTIGEPLGYIFIPLSFSPPVIWFRYIPVNSPKGTL